MKFPIRILLAASLLFSASAFSDTLTLHFYPSPHGINWETPQKLAFSTLVNLITKKDKGYKRAIGHAAIELNCAATEDREAVHIYRGSSAAYTDEREELLTKHRVGMGILFYTMEGRMETRDNLEEKIERRLTDGRNSYVEYNISPETCQRLHEYTLEYEARGYHDFYGLPNRPRDGEGAGCTAFIVSYLSVAGLLDEEYYEAWSKNIRVPMSLIGGKFNDRRVSILKMLLTNRKWAKENERHMPVFFWDPDEMHRWVKTTHKNKGLYGNLQFEPLEYKASKGLGIDVRHVPTPTDPFFSE